MVRGSRISLNEAGTYTVLSIVKLHLVTIPAYPRPAVAPPLQLIQTTFRWLICSTVLSQFSTSMSCQRLAPFRRRQPCGAGGVFVPDPGTIPEPTHTWGLWL